MADFIARLTAVGPWTLCNQLSQGWVPMRTSAPTKRETVLLIHAHPLAGSFSGALASAVRRGLEAGGKDVISVSLYADGFEPRLSADERRRYLGPTAQDPALPPYPAIPPGGDVAQSVDALRRCDAVVFVYPTWWFNVPAVLKGWLDRVFLPGVAFRLPHLEPPDAVVRGGLVPCLEHVGKLGIVSTYGSPRSLANALGDNGRNMLCTAFLPLFAADCRVAFHGLYEMDTSTDDARAAFLAEVERYYREDFS